MNSSIFSRRNKSRPPSFVYGSSGRAPPVAWSRTHCSETPSHCAISFAFRRRSAIICSPGCRSPSALGWWLSAARVQVPLGPVADIYQSQRFAGPCALSGQLGSHQAVGDPTRLSGNGLEPRFREIAGCAFPGASTAEMPSSPRLAAGSRLCGAAAIFHSLPNP